MARNSKSSGRNARISTAQNTRLGDIYTAAKSTMEPKSYAEGYPANPGELLNQNFADHKRTRPQRSGEE